MEVTVETSELVQQIGAQSPVLLAAFVTAIIIGAIACFLFRLYSKELSRYTDKSISEIRQAYDKALDAIKDAYCNSAAIGDEYAGKKSRR